MCHRFASRVSISFCVLALLSVASLIAPRTAIAQTYTFSQTAAGTYFWADAANWGGSGPPNAISDIANLGGITSATKTLELNTAITVGTINFLGSDSYVITPGSGGSLILNQGLAGQTAVITMNVGSASQTIIAPITVTDDHLQITQNSATGTLTLGTLTMSTARTLGVDGIGDIVIGGITIDQTVGGTFTFSNTSVGTAGSLHITGGITKTNLVSGNNLTVTISGAAMTTTIDGTVNLYSGSGATGALTLSNNGLTVFNGDVNVNAFNIRGDSSAVLNATSTFGSVLIGQSNTGTILASLDVNAATSLGTLLFGRGTLRVNSADVTYETTTGFTAGSSIEIADGITFGLNAAGQRATFNTDSGGGSKIIKPTGDNATFASNINMQNPTSNPLTLLPDGDDTLFVTGTISGTGVGGLTKAGTGTLVLTGDNSYTAGTLSVTVGTVRLASPGGATYAVISMSTGTTLKIDNNATWTNLNLNGNNVVELANGVSLSSLLTAVSGGTTKTLSIAPGVSGAVATYGGAIAIAHTIAQGFVVAADATQTLTLGGVISGTGAAGITKRGAGTVVISNAGNTYTGVTNVNEGTLQVTASNALTFSTGLTLGNISLDTPNQTVTLDLGATNQSLGSITAFGATATNGISAHIVGTGTISLRGNVVAGSAGRSYGTATISPNIALGANRIFTVTNSLDTNVGAELVVDGIITGAFSLTKGGDGQLALTATNSTFSGGVAVSAGILEVKKLGNSTISGGASSLGTGGANNTITITGLATLLYTGAGETTDRKFFLPTASSSASSLLVNATGTTTFAGTIDAVTSATSTLVVGGSSDVVYTGAIGTGADTNVIGVLTKVGASTWTLSATSRGTNFGSAAQVNVNEGKLVYEPSVAGFLNLRLANSNTTATMDARSGMNFSGGMTFGGAAAGSLSQANLVSSNGAATVTNLGGIVYDATGNPLMAVISVPTLSLQAAQTINVGNSSSTTIELRIVSNITGNAAITKTGGGTLEIMNGNALGFTAIRDGTIRFNYASGAVSKVADAGDLILTPSSSSGIRLEFMGPTVNTTETMRNLSLSFIGQSTVSVSGASGAQMTLSLGGINQAATGGLVNFQTDAFGSITTTIAASTQMGAWARLNDGWVVVGTGATFRPLENNSFTTQNNVALWTSGHITNAGGGFSGTVNGSQAIDSLRFNVAADSTVAIGSGQTLTINNGGILVTSTVGSNNSTITGGSIRPTGPSIDLYFYNESSGTLTVASNVLSSSSGITDLHKSGLGTVVLSGINAYNGDTYIDQGVLRVLGGNAIPDASIVRMVGNLEVAGDETVGGFETAAGTVTIDDNVTLRINSAIASTATGSFNIAGGSTGTLIKDGTGIFTLSASSNAFLGNVVINAGRIDLFGASFTFGGQMNGVAGWTINTGGALMAYGANAGDPNRLGNTATVTLAGGTLIKTNHDNQSAEFIGTLALAGGNGFVTVTQASTTGAAAQLFTTTLQRTNNATMVVRGTRLGAETTFTANQISRFGVTNLPSDSPLVGGGTTADTITIAVMPWAIGSSSTTTLTQPDNPTGFLTYDTRTTIITTYGTVQNGFRTLSTSEVTAYATAGTNNVSITTTASGLTGKNINSLVMNSDTAAFTVAGTGTLTVDSGGILFTAASANMANGITLGGFTDITPGSTYSQHYVHVWTNTATISSLLANASTGTADLIKAGTGTLVLTAANTYTGNTYLNDGTLQLFGGTNRLPSTSALTLSAGSTYSRLDLNGNDQQLAGIYATHSLASIINAGAGTATLTVSVASGVDTYSGIIAANDINLVKNGVGALHLTGANTSYTGSTTVNAGLLSISGNWAGTGPVDVAGGTFGGDGTIERSVGVSGGTISLASTGVLNHASGMAVTGGAWAGNGSVTSVVTQTSGTFEVLSGATLNNNSGYSLTSGTLLANGTVNGNVTVDGGTLGGGGTISGTVTVNSGDLSPGNSPGTLTLGDLDMNGGNYLWQLADLTTSGPGTNFDFVLVDAGDADLSNAANVVLDFSLLATLDQPGVDNAFWLSDHVWTILSVTGGGLVNGTFADLNQIVDLGGFGTGVFSLGYDTTNVFLNYNVAAVPEPGSLLLATLGAAGFGLRRWRKKAKTGAA